MADRILVSTTEMASAITKYEQARATLQEAYKKLQGAREHLDRCYKGPAYIALCVKYADIYANVVSADRAIDASVLGLRKTISVMSEAEGGNQQEARGAATGSRSPIQM